jgi:hypothetical protein
MPGFIPDVQGIKIACTARVGIIHADDNRSLCLPVCKALNEMSERGRAGGATRENGASRAAVLFDLASSIYHGAWVEQQLSRTWKGGEPARAMINH